MRIVAPLSTVEAYPPLVEAGADEFFCGVIPYTWLERFQVTVPINRREYFLGRFQSNICGMGQMEVLSRAVQDLGVPVKVALNAHYYIEEAYPMLAELVGELGALGFDTLIISDPALMVYLRDHGIDCKIHLSGELMVLSAETLRFFTERFNVTRLVFPRKIAFENVARLTAQNPSLEYEAFALNSLCPWSGGLCQSLHTDELPHMCEEVYDIVRISAERKRFPEMDETFETLREIKALHESDGATAAHRARGGYRLGAEGCGLCRIRQLQEVGVGFLKVVGRGYAIAQLVNDIQQVKACVRLAEETDATTYAERIKQKLFGEHCPAEVGDCYYLDPPGDKR